MQTLKAKFTTSLVILIFGLCILLPGYTAVDQNDDPTIVDFRDQGLTDASTLSFEEGIVDISLDNNQLGDTVLNLNLPNVLDAISIDNNGVTTLVNFPFPESLRVFFARDNNISNIRTVYPEDLQFLFLSSNQITDLTGVVFNKNLKTLSIRNNPIDSFIGFVPPSGLESLDISGTDVFSDPLDGQKLNLNDGLKVIKISNAVLDAGVPGIDFPDSIEELDLSSNTVLTDLSQIDDLPNLKRLDVQRCDIRGPEDLPLTDTLERLEIGQNNQFTSSTIDPFIMPTNLRILSAFLTGLNNYDSITFNENLVYLDLRSTFPAEGFSDFRPNEGLRTLILSSNGLRSDDIRTLRVPRSLRYLDLRGNRLTSRLARTLRLRRSQRLIVDLRGNPISEFGQRNLRRRYPRARFRF